VRHLLSFCLVTHLLSIGFGQTPPRPLSDSEMRSQLDQKTPAWLKQFDVPSVAVAYIREGKIDWTAVYGEQSPGVPANAKTLYNVASLAKPISAEVILRLASAGKLSLDESISTYWIDPDAKDNPWHALLTPRLCLSHQTGFTNWRRQTNNVLTFQWQPGTRTGYSGEGFQYVARFVEKRPVSPSKRSRRTTSSAL
jgi:CubicO group peptidase (beta-lactamase class C family)